MKRILFSTIVLLTLVGGSAQAQAQSHEFGDVTPGSWPYAAFAQLAERGELEGYKQFTARALTRYEFAVALARWMSNHERNDSFNNADKSTKDIICALGYEFEPEIARINGRGGLEFSMKNTLDEKRAATKASDWLDVWRNTPYGEERIQVPPRKVIPASFLRRRLYSQQSLPPYLRNPQYTSSNPFVQGGDNQK